MGAGGGIVKSFPSMHVLPAYCIWWRCIIKNWGCFVGEKLKLPHDKTNKMTVRPAKTQISLDAQSNKSLRCALNG